MRGASRIDVAPNFLLKKVQKDFHSKFFLLILLANLNAFLMETQF